MNETINQIVNPAFDNKIGICFCSDENYLPYLSVAVQSITNKASSDFNYDIVVLCSNINQKQKRDFIEYFSRENISIRFLDIEPFIKELTNENLPLSDFCTHLTIAMYYRYFIPIIFRDYNKIIYLDCDLIICKDIKELCVLDIGKNLLAAVKDSAIMDIIIKNKAVEIAYQKLPFENFDSYVNSGVLLFNIKASLEFDLTKKLLDKTKKLGSLLISNDQDVFNIVCKNNIKFIDQKYNYMTPSKNNNNKNSDFVIRHYAGVKPWNDFFVSDSEIFWDIVRECPIFYEKILANSFYKFIYKLQTQIEHKTKRIKRRINIFSCFVIAIIAFLVIFNIVFVL